MASAKVDAALPGLLAGMVGLHGLHRPRLEIRRGERASARKAQVVAIRDTIARLDAATDSAKKELAKGTVEDLRKRLETYRAASRCSAGWCPSGTRCPTCWTTSRPGARSAA